MKSTSENDNISVSKTRHVRTFFLSKLRSRRRTLTTMAGIFTAIAVIACMLGKFPGVAAAQVSGDVAGSRLRFERVSRELSAMTAVFEYRGEREVVFDADAAARAGFSEEAVLLARQLTAYTNELTESARDLASSRGYVDGVMAVDIRDVNVDERKYEAVEKYFREAGERLLAEARDANNGTPKDVDTPSQRELVGINENLAMIICGSFVNPKPSRAAPIQIHQSNDPAATLRSWGYHQTPDTWGGFNIGGGWTRPQTYQAWVCGIGSFRDHAWVSQSQPTTLREQNYAGWTPRGEPNPEVWRYYWPYLVWPAYVRFWHWYF